MDDEENYRTLAPRPEIVPQLPLTGFLRQSQILGDKHSDPPSPPIIPVSKSNWWDGIRGGKYPLPIKLGPGITAWRAEDIRALIERLTQEGRQTSSNRGAQLAGARRRRRILQQ